MAKAARATVDADQDVALADSKGSGNPTVKDLNHLLHLQVMIAGTECAHLILLTLLGVLGDLVCLCPTHAAAFLDPFKVMRSAISALNSPSGTPGEHLIHLLVAQMKLASAPDPGRHPVKQRVGQPLLERQDILQGETRMQTAHAAGDIQTHTPRKHHPPPSPI